MIEDCVKIKLNPVITEIVSRFGRDTVEALETIRLFKEQKVHLIFDQENFDTFKDDGELILSIYESVSHADNESRGRNIQIGHRH
ncbi:Resolvase, N terminal domain [Facklamia miroungae]|uniref:Resolvase, N terminal domain n=1 Tax=Facklamia miroungae TaxID=120956 RepID=A0A1G7TAU2_9LACT|nr:recombinase family protein [Facklamia miroungae]SDG32477.1 Resolvase, N terminal domain [Facklamia miroungae]